MVPFDFCQWSLLVLTRGRRVSLSQFWLERIFVSRVIGTRVLLLCTMKKNGGNGYEVALNKQIHPGFGNLHNGFRSFEYYRLGGTESEPTGASAVDGISVPRSRPRGTEGA
jgi:hypothetical protein